MVKSKVIRITLKTLGKIKEVFPSLPGESVAKYFDRLAVYINDYEYTLNELDYRYKHGGIRE